MDRNSGLVDRGVGPARAGTGSFAERVAARRALLSRGIDRFVAICRELPDVRAVYVFGSYAVDGVRPRSDLDLLVVRDTTVRRIDRDLDLRLAFDVPVGIDVVVVTPDEFANRLPKTGFGRTILAQAKAVYAA